MAPAAEDASDDVRGGPARSGAHGDGRLALIAEIARDLSAPWSADDLLQVLLSRLTTALDADRSTLFLVDGDMLWSRISQGGVAEPFRVRIGQGLAGWVAQSRRSVNVKNAYADPRFDPSWDRKTGYQTGSLLCQPVLDRDENLVAVVQVLNKKSGYFTVEDERLLTTILSMAAISLVNTQLAEELAKKNSELQTTQLELADRVREIDMLYDLEREVARATAFDDAVRAMVERISYTLHADLLQVAVRTEVGGLVLYRALGPDWFEVLPMAEPRGLMARVFDHGKAYNPCDMPRHELEQCALDEQLPWVPGAGLCVPLERDDGLVGALAVYWRPGRHTCISEDQTRVVELTADQMGHALGQRLARSQAEREDRLAAIGSALASVVHDFRTPMTVASGYVQLLKREEDAQERAALASGVLEQLQRMMEMTKDILGFARGDKQLLVHKVQLGLLGEQVETLLRGVLDGADVRWRLTVLDRGIARLDSGKVLRAIQNLARNAREAFNGEPHRFDVTLAGDATDVIITCSDDGPGVPREFQHRLFEAFATHGKKDGTGLGLAMVKQVADLHGGTVTYRDSKDGGATFELRLPREGPSQPRPTLPAPQGPMSEGVRG